MRIQRVSAEDYRQVINAGIVYNGTAFSQLNSHKVEDVHYLLFSDSKVRLGLVLGQRGDTLCSPFSAPFGGFSSNTIQKISHYDEAVQLLRDYARSEHRDIKVVLPPLVYDDNGISRQVSSFTRYAQQEYVDTSMYMQFDGIVDYNAMISPKARQKFRRAMEQEWEFTQIWQDDIAGIGDVYEVICRNREEKGYRLNMTLEDVINTSKVVHADFFLLSHGGENVASALVYKVTADVYQLIYWGNIGEYNALRPMNVLAFKLYEYYKSRGIRILDIGPSSNDGVPDYGLTDFKESVGCRMSLKYHFLLKS